jgi:hypothetical protein
MCVQVSRIAADKATGRPPPTIDEARVDIRLGSNENAMRRKEEQWH